PWCVRNSSRSGRSRTSCRRKTRKNSSPTKRQNGATSSARPASRKSSSRVSDRERVLVAGAGPVGLTAASNLALNGVPVTVLEAGRDLSEESRASTFHPPTLDMLHRLGAAAPLMAQGLVAPCFQYRSRQHGVLGTFDFAVIADVTGHPHRVQSEQS